MAPKASAYFDALRIPLLLLGVFGIAFAAYYFLYVTSQQEYLTGRDFRLLATVGEQIDAAIENDHVVLSNLLSVDRAGGQTRDGERKDAPTLDAMIDPLAAEFIPVLRTARLTEPGANPCVSKQASPPTLRIKFVEQDSGATWVHCDDEAGRPAKRPVTVQLDLDAVLKPLLTGELQSSIFDAVFVAASDGRVIFRSGDPRLRITRLDKLSLDSKPPAELDFGQVSRSSAMVDVRLSGLRYRLLLQPCCGRMVRDATTVDAGAGWVLGGLTAQSTMSAASGAVSFSMMTLLMVVVLLALFSWPFLKLRFIGEAQRVKAHDVVLVGIGALLSIALITVSTLDLYAYWRLETVLDDQLQRFAWTIKSQAQQEISAAYSELTHLRTRFANAFPGEEKVRNLGDRDDSAGQDFVQYPFFESLAFLDESGEQRQKLAFDSFVTPLINTSAREYFSYWQSSGSQPAFLQPLQSATTGSREAVLSAPVLKHDVFRVAAMTIPMHALIDPVIPPGFGFAVISLEGQVLFHSDPDHNLSENFFVEADGSRRLRALVSARHEEWVDFKYWGGDHRAWVTPMELTINLANRGAGAPIAASGAPWTLVTFYDKDLARTVNVEWLVIVVVLLVSYTSIYVAICVGVLFVRPKYRAPWLWPDPIRSSAYLAAIPPSLILVFTFTLSIALLSPADLIGVAVLLPPFAWVLTYRMMAPFAERAGMRRVWAIAACVLAPLLLVLVRSGILGWRGVVVAVLGSAGAWAIGVIGQRSNSKLSPLAPPVSVSYGFAAGLFLLIIAAMPSAAFFKVAYDTQLESFIKYGQLHLALDRSEHESLANGTLTRRITPTTSRDRVAKLRADRSQWWGGYDTFFFCTQPLDRMVERVPGCPPAVPPATGRTAGEAETHQTSGESKTLTAIIEELLPFYSEFSVRLREFVHDQPADKSRSWNRSGANLYFRMGPTEATAFASLKPSFIDWGIAEQSSFWGWILLALVAAGVLGAVVWVARFITHTVFVVDVIEPLWSGNDDPLGETWGSHLFVVSGEQEIDRPQLATYSKLDLAEAPSEDAEESRWFDDQLDRLAQTSAGQNVLILHFERRLQDRRFNERKLATLERIVQTLHRTIVIISAAPPGVFFTASATARDQNTSRRWTELLSRFTVIPARPVAPLPPASKPADAALTEWWATAGWREVVWRLSALGFAQRAKFLQEEQRHPLVGRLWKAVLPYAWHPDRPALDVTQLLVEVGERAECYYREIWATCTPAEKLALGQVAEEGLVNEKTKMTVRLLMARGLIRRQPHFVVMNETFRQFVLSPYVRSEVAALEEQSSGAWDVIRWPFLVVLIVILSFFFTTQQELSKTVLGVVAAAATVLPAVVKIASMFGDRQSAA
jgi:hypothetical protein